MIKKILPAIGLLLTMYVPEIYAVQLSSASNSWKPTHAPNTVEIVQTPGVLQGMIKFCAPKWRGPQSIWPAFENRGYPRDWSAFDRLAIPFYGDSDSGRHLFGVWISDSQRKLQKGVYFEFRLDHPQAKMLVLPIGKAFAEKKLDVRDIAVLHCFTENPPADHRVYIGEPHFLKPGDPVPELSPELIEYATAKKTGKLSAVYDKITETLARLNTRNFSPEQSRFWENRKQRFLQKLQAGEFDRILLTAGEDIMDFRSLPALFTVFRNPPAANGIQLGYAPATWKVLPKAPVFNPLPEKLYLEAARNENESLQLVVMPLRDDCRNVKIHLSDFAGEAGKLPETAVRVMPVGFVETKFIAPYGSRHVGFWPDPLLPFLKEVTVKAGDAQPFWLKAMIPANQPAGEYFGNVRIVADEREICNLPLTIKVRDFTLPGHSMLPLAVTFGPVVRSDPGKPEVGSRLWRKHMDAWHEMLTGYYLHFDHLYWSAPPAEYFDYWKKQLDQGNPGYFNLGNFKPATDTPDNQYGLQYIIDRIRPGYEEAKKRGLLPYAYIYGADEVQKSSFPNLERAATILKKEFPGVPIFTTATDESYGTDGVASSIDWYCPLTRNYNVDIAEKARAEGRKVWWYISNASLPPDANNFVESRAIEIRLLMGAMAKKYKVDGFLYYYTSFWNREEPITQGPYTDMDARSYPGYNGDGNWCYPGPDHTPLATIRLENFRDGLEDYAYMILLEDLMNSIPDTPQNKRWREAVTQALQIPAELVKNLTVYSDDFDKLQQWRTRLAELIESAPDDKKEEITMTSQKKINETFVVQDVPGYNSWPMIQALGDKLVCTYSRGAIHTIDEPARGVYARTSSDNGRSWSEETLVANSPEWGEVPIGKGVDAEGAMLLWVRSWGKNKHHDLYRTIDGVNFTRIASLQLNPHPMQITDIFNVPDVGLMALWFTGNYAEGGLNSWGTLTSTDNGKTWKQQVVESDLPRTEWPTEPSAVYWGNGRILAIARTEVDSRAAQFQLESEDYGKTWKRFNTNIEDVAFSTPSLVFDPETGLVSNYYYQRGKGLLKRRVGAIDRVAGNPLAWPEPEVLATGSTSFWDAGNVNVTTMQGKHFPAFYSGDAVNASVLVAEVDAP